MLRKGFTLIELLIVITIIAILAGAAIPYVQDYVEDARFSKAKADLEQIRNALIRYETDRGDSYATSTISLLVGPYLQSSLVDPWGSSYAIAPASSTAICYGPNRALAGGDDIIVDFRPPLALSKAYWEDSNQDGSVGGGDSLILYFTRPVATTSAPLATAFSFSPSGSVAFPAITGANYSSNARSLRIPLTTATFSPGTTILGINTPTAINDPAGNNIRNVNNAVIKAR